MRLARAAWGLRRTQPRLAGASGLEPRSGARSAGLVRPCQPGGPHHDGAMPGNRRPGWCWLSCLRQVARPEGPRRRLAAWSRRLARSDTGPRGFAGETPRFPGWSAYSPARAAPVPVCILAGVRGGVVRPGEELVIPTRDELYDLNVDGFHDRHAAERHRLADVIPDLPRAGCNSLPPGRLSPYPMRTDEQASKGMGRGIRCFMAECDRMPPMKRWRLPWEAAKSREETSCAGPRPRRMSFLLPIPLTTS